MVRVPQLLTLIACVGCGDQTLGNLAGESESGTDPTGAGVDTGSDTVSGSVSGSDGDTNAASGGLDDDSSGGECSVASQPVQRVIRPADIIVPVYAFAAMIDETDLFVPLLTEFFSSIDAVVDPHFVLISEYPGVVNGVCLGPPIGSDGCPTDDNNLPTYVHVNEHADNNEGALMVVVDEATGWQPVARERAVTHVVVIASFDAAVTVEQYTPEIEPLVYEHVVHTSVPAESQADACVVDGPCCLPQLDGPAPLFTEHANSTGGVVHDMCSLDFAEFFDQVAARIVEQAPDPCRWTVPDADLDLVNVTVQLDGGAPRAFDRVIDLASCGASPEAWAYDDFDAPTEVVLCPTACEAVTAADEVDATLDVGCPSRFG